MTIVNSKQEFEQALKSKETEILVTDKIFLTALYVVNIIKNFKPTDLVKDCLVNNVCAAVDPTIIKWSLITLSLCLLAISIYAITKDYNVEIEVDYKSGVVRIKYNK